MPNAPRTHRQAAGARRGKRIDRRLPSSQRGYDQHWTRLRASYAKRFPLCCACWANDGRVVPLDEVDHIIPIAGKTDPLRLDERDLQGLCSSHHRRKTQDDDEIRAEYDRLLVTVGHDRAVDVVTGRWRVSRNARGYTLKSSAIHG